MQYVSFSFVLLVAQISSTVNASWWALISENSSTAFYVDIQSINTNESTRTAQVLVNSHNIMTTTEKGRTISFLSSKSSMSFDCTQKAFSVEEILYTGPLASGQVADLMSYPSKQARKGTEEREILDFVCNWSQSLPDRYWYTYGPGYQAVTRNREKFGKIKSEHHHWYQGDDGNWTRD